MIEYRNRRIAFCGLGSIGRRHLKNVCAYLDGRGGAYEIDLYRSGPDRDLPEGIRPAAVHQFPFSPGPERDCDAVFVTNPTSLHYETLRKFKGRTRSFFIEKPVFDSTAIDESIFDELKGVICYVACPLRYSPVLQYVKEHVSLQEVYAARAISSSYLPDWRPGRDYRQCYSARRDMGGGAGLDLIHEWDYLTSFFGMPQQCHSIQDKVSNLEIDSDDIAIYIAKAGGTAIELHLDYFGRQSIRTLDLFLPGDTIHCDLLAGTVKYLKRGRTFRFDAGRDVCHTAEIEHFFDIMDHKTDNDSTAEHAYAVLKLAKGL